MAPALPVFAGEPAPTGNAHDLEILTPLQEQQPEQNPKVSAVPVGAGLPAKGPVPSQCGTRSVQCLKRWLTLVAVYVHPTASSPKTE